MSEQHMRQKVVRALKELDAVSVENPARPGTPDVNFIEGWIELKQLPEWPNNADDSPVLVRHFTPQQRVWLSRRSRLGGNVFMLLQVKQDWILLEGAVAADHMGVDATREDLFNLAYRHWPAGLEEAELIEVLTRCQRP